MRKLYCTILFFILSVSQAQEILSQPESKTDHAFPFFKQYSGGVMVVQAKFADVPDTLNFILDTGSSNVSLDSSTCVEFKIPSKSYTDTTITGIGVFEKVRICI